MARPDKITKRVEDAFKKRSKTLTKTEQDIIDDVGVLENNLGSLMDLILRNYTLACSIVLQSEYKFSESETERFIKLAVTRFDKIMNQVEEKLQ